VTSATAASAPAASAFARAGAAFERSRILRWLALVGLYCALPAALFLPRALRGTATFFNHGDAIEQSYPWALTIARALHAGHLPLWNAHSQGGTSFVGEIQSGAFYPVTWAFAWLFGSPVGIDLVALECWVIVHFTIAMLGMHWLARELGGSRISAIFAAMAFALLGPVLFRASAQVGIFFGLAWMPVAFALAWRFLRGGAPLNCLAAGAVVATQVNAGHIQPAFHTLLLIGSLAGLELWRSPRRATVYRFLQGALLGAVGVVIVAGPQLWLGIEYLGNVYRWIGTGDPITSWERLPLRAFLTLYIVTPLATLSVFDPWRFPADDANSLFLGLPLLGVLALGLWAARMRLRTVEPYRQLRPWLAAVGIGGLVLSLGAYTLLPLGIYFLPLGTAVRSLGRYVILFHFVVCLLLVFVVDHGVRAGLVRDRLRAWPLWVLVLLVLHGVGWSFYKGSPLPKPVAYQALLLGGLLVVARWRVDATIAAMAGSVLFCAWLVRDFAQRPVDPARSPVASSFVVDATVRRVLQDPAPLRVLIDESAKLPANYGIVTGIHTKMGHGATYYRPYFDFIRQDWTLESKVNDALAVGWVLARRDLPLPLETVDPVTGMRLYRRPSAWPRAWLASTMPDLARGAAVADTVQWDEYANGRLRLRITAPTEDKLILAEVAYPGWVATVNGQPVAIERAATIGPAAIFRSIPVPAGTSSVELRYRPFARVPLLPAALGG
jgi:hypothetical protein